VKPREPTGVTAWEEKAVACAESNLPTRGPSGADELVNLILQSAANQMPGLRRTLAIGRDSLLLLACPYCFCRALQSQIKAWQTLSQRT
jgi:hypothetical protein